MRVLVPFDGSEMSEQAAVMALELLAQHKVELVLLHVAPDHSHADTASLALNGAAQRLSGSPAEVKPILAFGRPDVEIAKYAERVGAGLIAMSTHGRSMLARMLVGSVADRVIRTAPVPVLVLHPPTMSLGRVTPPAGRKLRILAPYDGSPFAAEAIMMSVSLLRPEHIEMELLTTVVVPDLQTHARQLLEQTASQLRERGVITTTRLVFGDAAPTITRLAHDGGFDLLVMSTHGHGMLARALIGSTTDKLVRTADIPVLVVQPHSMDVPADPVSGEVVDPDTAPYTSEYHGRVFAFTSLEHKQAFDGAPEAYIGDRLARPRGFSKAEEGMVPTPASPAANGG